MTEVVTPAEAAEELGYHVNHIYRLIRLGVVNAERFSDRWAIDREEIERLRSLQDKHGRIHHGKTGATA
jgi:excisionase family DNA binding protein